MADFGAMIASWLTPSMCFFNPSVRFRLMNHS
jgi:hypothetical protein